MSRANTVPSNMTRWAIGLLAFLAVGVALAKDPPRTTRAVSLPPAGPGCIDSPRGRTHVLRLCGEQHHWFKLKTARSTVPPGYGFPYWAGGPVAPTVSVIMNR
jgi:hypothetical protein